MQEHPLVSIIIPTYNRAHLIGETLDSVLVQTYTHWECIVVDDGSTDGTDEVLATYVEKDSRFQYHHRPKSRPKGANSCRNYGFELSKGKYIQWLDSDDLILSHKVREALNSFFQFPKLDCFICQTELYDKKTKISLGLRSENIYSSNPFDDFICFKIFWLIEAPLWKKSFLKIKGLEFDEDLQQSQDYDYHIRILATDLRFKASNKVGVKVSVHDNNMSNSIIDSPEKFISNVNVRYRTLYDYHDKLMNKTRLFLFESIYGYFLTSITSQNLKTRLMVYSFLVRSLIFFKNPIKSKVLASIKWCVGAITKNPRFLKRFTVL